MSEKKPDTSNNDKVIRLTTRFTRPPPPPPKPVVVAAPPPKPKKRRHWLYILIGLVVTGILLVGYIKLSSKPPFHITVVGPMTGQDSLEGIGMREGAELCIQEFNQRGGINGHPIKLITMDDGGLPEQAKKRALEIAQTNTLGVLGHNTSDTSLVASPIYREHGLVAITGSATTDAITRDNEWYFRVTFNNSDQAALSANYIHKVLNQDTANIIFVEDPFGETLARSFIETAKTIGLTIENVWSFQPVKLDKTSLERTLATVEDSLKQRLKSEAHAGENLPILFIATRSAAAVEIVTSLHGLGKQLHMMGADTLSKFSFSSGIQRYPQERTRSGYFTEGLYIISPFLPDIASQRAQVFFDDFHRLHQHGPSTVSAMYYDATLILLSALEQAALAKPKADLKQLRQLVRDKLTNYSTVNTGIEGVTGDLYFDQYRNSVKTIPVGVFQNGEAINALEQFQPIPDLRRVDHLLEEALNNQIIHVNGRFMRRTQVVYTGIDFNELTDLNAKDGTFKADFYLWFRFRDKFDENKIDFLNATTPIDLGKPIVESVADDAQGKITTKTYRVRGRFKINMNFASYPFDKQQLSIRFRHASLTREKLIYVVDTLGLQVKQLGTDGILGKFARNKVFSIGGWAVEQITLFQNVKKNDSTLGISQAFGSQQRIEYSQFNAEVGVQRLVLSFVLKNLLPIVFLVVLGYATFFIPIPTTGFPVRMGLGTNMIVTTSLFHLRLSSNIPDIDYIVLIEYVFYCVYLLAIFCLGLSIGSYFLGTLKPANFEQKIEQLNLIGKIVYPLSIAILITYIVVVYG